MILLPTIIFGAILGIIGYIAAVREYNSAHQTKPKPRHDNNARVL